MPESTHEWVSLPVPYTGRMDPNEIRLTHNWVVESPDEPMRCLDCDSKAGSTSAGWPCGARVPRFEKLIQHTSKVKCNSCLKPIEMNRLKTMWLHPHNQSRFCYPEKATRAYPYSREDDRPE